MAPVLICRAWWVGSGGTHVLEQVRVEIGLRVEHHALLRELQLVQEEHDDDARGQGGERGVEGDTECFRYAIDVSGHGLVRLLQGCTDAAHRTDEADGWDRPHCIANHRELR